MREVNRIRANAVYKHGNVLYTVEKEKELPYFR